MQVGRCIPASGGGHVPIGVSSGRDQAPSARDSKRSADPISISVSFDPAPVLAGLDLIQKKLIEIREEAERTAAALAMISP